MAKRHGTTNLSPKEKAKALELREQGWTPTEISRHMGRSVSTIKRLFADKAPVLDRREQQEIPEPKEYHELSEEAKRSLADFPYFRKVFFGRHEAPWAKVAAERAVELILDESQINYEVVNICPGAGKTSLWTHDIVAWLLCGGGLEDPAKGRTLRFMLGSATKNTAESFVRRLRNTLTITRPFYDPKSKCEGELVLAKEFGRFKPKQTMGEDTMWTKDQFLVAQVGGIDVVEKEPHVQAASRESGFLGQRVNMAIWDDLVTKQNSRAPEIAEPLAEWFEDEAEPRVESGGVLFLVGQRLGPHDLYRNRLDATYEDEHGETVKKYTHTVYKAHYDEFCDEDTIGPHCRQWDGGTDGCLIDEKRRKWKDLLKFRSGRNWATVFQQEDADPGDILVQPTWIHGGTDSEGFMAPGCKDMGRSFWEWPRGRRTITYAVVDPSATKYWGIEVWAVDIDTEDRFLIYGERRQMKAGLESGFLDYDPQKRECVGLMEDLQRTTGEKKNPIHVWVVEQNAAHRYLLQTFAFRMWQRRWPLVKVWPHETQRNKIDPDYGVEALMQMPYRLGMKRLPWKKGVESRNYLGQKEKELTTYPNSVTSDLIMCDWFGEYHLPQIKTLGKSILDNPSYGTQRVDGLPRYLQNYRRPPYLER